MVTEAQGRATRKYRTKAYDRIEVQVPKGTGVRGEALNAYIVSRVEGAYAHAEEIIDGSVPLVAPSQEPHKGPSEPSDS